MYIIRSSDSTDSQRHASGGVRGAVSAVAALPFRRVASDILSLASAYLRPIGKVFWFLLTTEYSVVLESQRVGCLLLPCADAVPRWTDVAWRPDPPWT